MSTPFIANPQVHIVEPHTIKSRPVDIDSEADYKRIVADAEVMHTVCLGLNGLAIAHAQITDEDPLQFFVTREGLIVVNPEIVRHTRHEVSKQEGCLSYPGRGRTEVTRWNKCEVKFIAGSVGGDDPMLHEAQGNLEGLSAQMFQHEMDHFEGKYVHSA